MAGEEKCITCFVNHSPENSNAIFLDKLDEYMDYIADRNGRLFVIGDCNIDMTV